MAHLEKACKRFKGKVLYDEEQKQGLETAEGISAYQSAIKFLRQQRPLPPMTWQPDLARASQDHVNDIGPKGMVSSSGSDGSHPTQRIERYAKIDESWSETSIYGALSTKEVLERMIVCDG